MVVHDFNPTTHEAEEVGSLTFEIYRASYRTTRAVLKNKVKLYPKPTHQVQLTQLLIAGLITIGLVACIH